MDKAQQTIIRQTFDAVSGGYDREVLRFFPDCAARLVEGLGLKGYEKVLDAACGTGHVALELSRALPSGHVTAVDLSSGMLEQARAKTEKTGLSNIEFVEVDIQELPFPPASFDAVTCGFGIFFVEDMDSQLSRFASLVKPGGTIALSVFQEDYFHPLRPMLLDRLQRFGLPPIPEPWKRIATKELCTEFLKKAGLESVRVEPFDAGYFLKDENEWWEVCWNAGYRRMINRIPAEDQERFRQETLRESAALKTTEGLWLDVRILVAYGRKHR
jgi:ubiquinone/menaquinone biosynthesis C-methylase UbiE